jgi:subtilisin family serine protease
VGIVGIAPSATLMPLRACWQDPEASPAVCSSFTLAKAIQYAMLHKVRVLNLSLAGPPDRLLERLIKKAVAQGITVVGALDPGQPDASFPADLPEVVAVASPDFRGPSPAAMHIVMAPGERILTTTPNASWGFVSGSSFAAAHVTGITALLLEVSPDMKPEDVAVLLHEYSPHGVAAGSVKLVDVCGMLAQLAQKTGCACCQSAKTRAQSRPGASGQAS